jgi:hypothetical protein
MTNKIRCALALLALVASGSASATTVNWGSITAPDWRVLYNDFGLGDLGAFSDRYNFTLTSGVNSFGGVVAFDPFLSIADIDLNSVSLWSGGSQIGYDASPWSFSFANLGAGSYSLHVDGVIGWEFGFTGQHVNYNGSINFTPGTTSVPEPGTLALAGLGLLGIAFAMRRRLFN